MVTIRKRRISNNEYYYLEHTERIGKKIRKKEQYLGNKIPENIEKIEKEFLNKIIQEKWYNQIDNIKNNYIKEYKKMPNEAKQKNLENYMIKFTYNTNRIEGGTLTLRETANLLQDEITPKEKPIKDVQETQAHKKVFYMTLTQKNELNQETILKWHKKLFENTKPKIAGKIRNYKVTIAGSKTEIPPPDTLNILLKKFFIWYNNNKNKLHPINLAATTHLKFVTIHPFADGNGRISRLIMNHILHKKGYPMLNITYNNRNSYYKALERSQTTNQDNIFLNHIIKRYIKEHKNYNQQKKI